jgi:hypothetical protein
MLREPLRHLRAEGLAIEALERSKLGIIERAVAQNQPSQPREDEPPVLHRMPWGYVAS